MDGSIAAFEHADFGWVNRVRTTGLGMQLFDDKDTANLHPKHSYNKWKQTVQMQQVCFSLRTPKLSYIFSSY